MKVLTWNVRGLGEAMRRQTLGRYLNTWGADVVLLEETKLEDCDDSLWGQIGGTRLNGHVTLGSIGRSGGCIIGWRQDTVEILTSWTNRYSITVHARWRSDGRQYLITGVYGPLNAGCRPAFWEELQITRSHLPKIGWLIGGDFNVTLEANDRPIVRRGRDSGAEEFRDFIDTHMLVDFPPVNCRFTWRSSASPTARSRLDRFLGSIEVAEAHQLAEVRAM